MGEKAFKQKPVGAGPFTVVSNSPSNQLVVQKNPGYFRQGRPYLDKVTFKSIGGDQAAYQALQAGQADAYEGISTPALVDQAVQAAEPDDDADAVDVALRASSSTRRSRRSTTRRRATPSTTRRTPRRSARACSTTATRRRRRSRVPAGSSTSRPLPGYKTFDLEKAKQLVSEMGGMQVTLGTINVLVAKQTTEALQSQWAKAGIKTKIESYDLAGLIKAFGGPWQSMLQTAGAWDPAIGVGVGFRFNSHSPFTGREGPGARQAARRAVGHARRGQAPGRSTTRRASSSATSPTPRSCSRSRRPTSR